jgi:hypothetical protein
MGFPQFLPVIEVAALCHLCPRGAVL